MTETTRPVAKSLTGGLALLFLVIFAVVAGEYATAHWFPAGDDALTLLRVRSVWSAHPPLIGLPGRIGTWPNYGSHPGPLSFFVLWPVYRLFGSSPWALQVSTLFLHLLAIVALLVLVHRRGRAGLVVGFAAALAVLVAFYGPLTVIQPWNPFLPTLWWMTFLVAAWAFMCGDRVAAPVAVVAGSFCAATHISYVGLVPGLMLVSVVVFALRVRSGRLPWSRGLRTSLVVSGVLGVVLWLPPVLDQLLNAPGNVSIIVRYFAHPPEAPVGVRDGVSLLLVHLNPWNLLVRRTEVTGSEIPGLLLLVVWAGSVWVAVRRRLTDLVLLDLLLAAGLVLGAVSLARIFGPIFPYLMLWSYSLLALTVIAICWTIVAVIPGGTPAGRISRWALGLGVAAAVVATGVGFARDVGERPMPFGGADQTALRVLVPETTRALDDRARRARGGGERYVVDWVDPYHLGNTGVALFSELERNGYSVGVLPKYRSAFPEHFLRSPAQADARVHLAVGADISAWRARPGAVEIASVDPRTRSQRTVFSLARARGLAALRAAGLEALAPELTNQTSAATLDPRLPPEARAAAQAMMTIGDRTSVFVVPLHRRRS